VNYRTIMTQMYSALYRANVGVDFVFPESPNLADYKVIVVPPLYVASDAVLARLSNYVNAGGRLVVAFKSGFCNEFSTVRWTSMPGPLKDAAGFHYQEFSNLEKPLGLKGDPFGAGVENKVSDWAEMITLDSAKALAYYEHPFFGKYPAITRNEFGRGSLTYEGTVLSDKLQQVVLTGVLKEAGLLSSDQTLPATVRIKHGTNKSGKTLHFYLNYSSAPQTIMFAYGAGTELLSQSAVAKGQSITLQPWDAAIVEEK
jgi:beta-galactosidase